jgi:predicted branched-subunit amino acid permease
MSALVFSGTAQVAVVQAWSGQPSLLVVLITVLVANLRYILIGAALRSWLAPLGPLKATLALLPLVDGSYALSSRARADGDQDAGLLVGSAMISYTGWVVGTGLGTVAGQIIPNPRAWGLDFIIVGFCAASAALLLRSRSDILPAVAAVAAVILCEHFAPGPWTVVAAGLSGVVVAAALYRPAATPAVTERKPA